MSDENRSNKSDRKPAGQHINLVVTRDGARYDETLHFPFGEGRVKVITGFYQSQPAVFIAPVHGKPGEPGAELPASEVGDRRALEPGEIVLTFPSATQAALVYAALLAQTQPIVMHGDPNEESVVTSMEFDKLVLEVVPTLNSALHMQVVLDTAPGEQ